MKKKEMLEFLNKVQGCLCCYSNDKSPTKFCDCKYGATNIGNFTEVGNGCPEMRLVIKFIESMPDFLFQVAIDRCLDRAIEKGRDEGYDAGYYDGYHSSILSSSRLE